MSGPLRDRLKRRLTGLAERIGAKVVTGLSDTSSDAPSGGYAPKRQAYDDWIAAEAERGRKVEKDPKR